MVVAKITVCSLSSQPVDHEENNKSTGLIGTSEITRNTTLVIYQRSLTLQSVEAFTIFRTKKRILAAETKTAKPKDPIRSR